MIAAATARMQFGAAAHRARLTRSGAHPPPIGELTLAISGGRETVPSERSDGSACHFAGRADHALGLELGERLLVLLVVPVDVAALVNGSRRPEQPVQALLKQRVLAPVLLSGPVTRRHGEM